MMWNKQAENLWISMMERKDWMIQKHMLFVLYVLPQVFFHLSLYLYDCVKQISENHTLAMGILCDQCNSMDFVVIDGVD